MMNARPEVQLPVWRWVSGHRRFCKRWRRPQILLFCGDYWRIRQEAWPNQDMHTPYMSVVPAKMQDLRPSPSFTKSSIGLSCDSLPVCLVLKSSIASNIIFFFFTILTLQVVSLSWCFGLGNDHVKIIPIKKKKRKKEKREIDEHFMMMR